MKKSFSHFEVRNKSVFDPELGSKTDFFIFIAKDINVSVKIKVIW
ncbi:hypothetical protein SAMN05443252_102195 [Bacillus sp. OV322]|nr:hypothetical protein SAMN05443252_102195 [Bacillus sp. OV322]